MIEHGSPATVLMGLAEESDFTPRELKLDEAIPDRTTKANAPPQFHPNEEPKTKAELMGILETSHKAYINSLNRVQDDTRLDTTSHPVFGRMSTRQWIEAAYYHEERHIRQIEEIERLLRAR